MLDGDAMSMREFNFEVQRTWFVASLGFAQKVINESEWPYQNRKRIGVPARAARVGWWMRPARSFNFWKLSKSFDVWWVAVRRLP